MRSGVGWNGIVDSHGGIAPSAHGERAFLASGRAFPPGRCRPRYPLGSGSSTRLTVCLSVRLSDCLTVCPFTSRPSVSLLEHRTHSTPQHALHCMRSVYRCHLGQSFVACQ